jgi:iron complex transport system substrate-binding protein
MQFKALIIFTFFCLYCSGVVFAGEKISFTDVKGNVISFADPVASVICSGPGALRLLTYLAASDLVVAVDDIESKRPRFDARPYAMANPVFRTLPIFGEFRGFDHPELILSLETQPQVIFKTYPNLGHDPVELQEKTGIPTVVLDYGDLCHRRAQLFTSLRTMGQIVGRRERAESVIRFLNDTIQDLQDRTKGIPEMDKKSCFIGGVANRGPHGFMSTELAYPPFTFVNAHNVADPGTSKSEPTRQVTISKEQLIDWNPDVLFLDLSTLQLSGAASGFWEIRNDSALKMLSAVQQKRVYGLLPYNWYTKNFGSSLANAYFIGKILYPKQFADVDPSAKADEIYHFLVGQPVFNEMNEQFGNLSFKAVLE